MGRGCGLLLRQAVQDPCHNIFLQATSPHLAELLLPCLGPFSAVWGAPGHVSSPPPSPGTPKRCPPVDGAAGRGQGKGAGWWCCKAGGDSLLSWAEGGRGHVALGEEGTEPISVTSVVLGSPLLPPCEGSQHQGLVCVLSRAALCWDEEEDGAGSLIDHVHIPSGLASFAGGLKSLLAGEVRW